jgi:chemotaxis protein MotB
MNNRRRRNQEPEADKSDLWLLTYSDMVTLCLTFFVLLYSFSTIDTVKWKSLVISLQGALGVMPGSELPTTTAEENEFNTLKIDEIKIEQYLMYEEEIKRMEEIQAKFDEFLSANNLEEDIATSMEERGVVIRFQDSVLFPKSSADLYQKATVILAGFSSIIAELGNPIRIEGHTDNLPINTERFPSNWELSTARATNVLRFLIKEGVSGEKLSAVGYGEFRPLVANDCEENRKKNRRVDIVLLRESLILGEPK